MTTYIDFDATGVDTADSDDISRAYDICQQQSDGQVIYPGNSDCHQFGDWILLCNSGEKPIALVNLQTGDVVDDEIRIAQNPVEKEMAAEWHKENVAA